mgnify:CR=1 FL=1
MVSRSNINKKVMEQICDRIAQGESLLTVVADADVPTSYAAVTRAVQRNEDFYEMYRRARSLQAEYYFDHITDIMMAPLPVFEDNRQANAYVTNNRNKVDALKWVIARMQPNGIRDKKEDAPVNQAITISWQAGDVEVSKADESLAITGTE